MVERIATTISRQSRRFAAKLQQNFAKKARFSLGIPSNGKKEEFAENFVVAKVRFSDITIGGRYSPRICLPVPVKLAVGACRCTAGAGSYFGVNLFCWLLLLRQHS